MLIKSALHSLVILIAVILCFDFGHQHTFYGTQKKVTHIMHIQNQEMLAWNE